LAISNTLGISYTLKPYQLLRPAIVCSKVDSIDYVRQATRTGCLIACKRAVASIGLDLGFKRINVRQEVKGELTINPRAYLEAKAYTDSLIDLGMVVVAGVNHSLGYKIGGAYPNDDKTTDHFIILTGFDTYWDPMDGSFNSLSASRYSITQIRIYAD